ncbi:uncharacterized protein LOC114315310 [Camellia sinensis]|uniref:uncharacterized protein LOC114315310 n=1 Tax=Camellia sinensis TaxID=4442 RepID=UPI00103580CE|nr:uncharacterized protein LOC114315310 [Camellia sinensis]
MKSWEGLAEMFVARFVTDKSQPLRVDSLLALKISDNKGLKAYTKRYYEVYNKILACNKELVVVSFKNGLDDKCSLPKSLAKTFSKSMEELIARIETYVRAEEDTQGARTLKQERRNSSLKRGRGNASVDRQEIGARAMQAVSTVFKISIYKVLGRIRNQPYYRAPEKVPGEFMGRSTRKHCTYHNEDGHLTQGCRALKSHLEDLVRQCHLKNLVDKAKTREEHMKLPHAPAAPPLPLPPQQAEGPRVINVIHLKVNENEVRGETQRVRHLQHVYQIQQKKPRTSEYQGPMISFTEADLDIVQHPHNDAQVVTLKIGDCQMYVRCYKELGLHPDDLEQSNSPMVGFNESHKFGGAGREQKGNNEVHCDRYSLPIQYHFGMTLVTCYKGCSLNATPTVAIPNRTGD